MKKLVLFITFIVSGSFAFPSSPGERSDSNDIDHLFVGKEMVFKDEDLAQWVVLNITDQPNKSAPEGKKGDSLTILKGNDDNIFGAEEPSDIIAENEGGVEKNGDDEQQTEMSNNIEQEEPIQNEDKSKEVPSSNLQLFNEIEKEFSKLGAIKATKKLLNLREKEDQGQSNDVDGEVPSHHMDLFSEVEKEFSKVGGVRAAKKIRKLRRKSFEIGFVQGFLEAFVEQELIRPIFKRHIKNMRKEPCKKSKRTKSKLLRKLKKLF